MKKLYFLLLLNLTCYSSIAQLWYDPFVFDSISFEVPTSYILLDSSESNLWQIAPPQKEILNSAFSPTHVIITDSINPYPIGANSYFDLFLSMENTVYFPELMFLSFKHKICSDSLLDGGYITYSCDMGETWLNIIEEESCHFWENHPGSSWWDGEYRNLYSFNDTLFNGEPGFSGCMEDWEEVILDFHYLPISPPKAELADTMIVRFNFISDSIDIPFDGWMIDDFQFFDATLPGNTDFLTKALFSLYPNPSNKDLHVVLEQFYPELEVVLFDYSGSEILTKSHPGEEILQLSVDHIPDGLYFLHITSKSQSLGVQKVMISH